MRLLKCSTRKKRQFAGTTPDAPMFTPLGDTPMFTPHGSPVTPRGTPVTPHGSPPVTPRGTPPVTPRGTPPVTPHGSPHRTHVATQRINRFMTKQQFKIKANYLDGICEDSVQCLMIGKEKHNILKLFENFNFDFMKHAKMLRQSTNGFVVELHYQRFHYNSYAVLKSNMRINGDNLLYEYLVGKYLNTLSPFVPTFVETYGVFAYTSSASYDLVKSLPRSETTIDFSNILVPVQETMKEACKQGSNVCVLTQDLKGAITLDEFLRKDWIIIDLHLPSILYLVYLTLEMLKDDFTHYDLHSGNVMLYRAFPNGCIKYTYKGLTFYSPFLVKIIDYGRCYFPGAPALKHDYMIEIECRDKPGRGKPGFFFGDPERSYWIASHIPNKSHDLRLIVECLRSRIAIKPTPFETLLDDNIVYGMGGTGSDSSNYQGTMPKPNGYPKINNVADAERVIRTYISDNGSYIYKTVNASMTIYGLHQPLDFVIH